MGLREWEKHEAITICIRLLNTIKETNYAIIQKNKYLIFLSYWT